MKESNLGNEAECIEFSRDTLPGTEDWWYHSGTEAECAQLAFGQKKITGKSRFWLSRCNIGATHKGDHTHVIRATVSVAESDEFSLEDPEFTGLADGHQWLVVKDPRRLMINSGWIRKTDQMEMERLE